MNLPNTLTLIRMPLTFVIVALMFGTWPWAATLAFGLFIAAAVTDWLDGKLARERNIVSDFGKFMDALTDKMLVLGVLMAVLVLDYLRMPDVLVTLLVLLVLMREFLISGLRMMAATRGIVLAAERGGKVKTAVQMTALGFLLAEQMLARDWPRLGLVHLGGAVAAVHWTGVVLFFVSMWYTLSSMWTYFRKYRHILLGATAA